MGGDVDNVEDMGYLQDIISYIFDEKKIVTYKWISSQLKIHVNRAKQLLYTFIKHLSEERLKELKVVYLLGGILPDNKGCRIQVVSEENLPRLKEQFKIITSEHIYSVSLKNCLSDLHDLYLVDGVKGNDIIRQGAVRCEEAIERDKDELTLKRKGAQRTSADDSTKWPTAKPKMSEKPNSVATNTKKKSSSSISAMFSAANNKVKADDASESENKKEKKVGNSSTATVKPPQKGAKTNSGGRLAAMFSAQSAKLKPAKVALGNIVKEEKETMSDKVKELPQKETSPKSSPKTATDKMSKSKDKISENSKPKQKKRKAKNKDDDRNKKRKRIVLMEDSDSSDDVKEKEYGDFSTDVFGSNEEDDVDKGRCPSEMMEEDEDIEEPVMEEKGKDPQPQPQPDQVNKRCRARKRVVVDKTFMDEDGYIVSKKVVEFVSCSEEEEEEKENEKEKQAGSKAPKIQKVPPAKKSPEKKKQATLMSFFKRN